MTHLRSTSRPLQLLLLSFLSAIAFAVAVPASSQAVEFGYVPCGDDQYDGRGREWRSIGDQVFGLRATCGKSFYQYVQAPFPAQTESSLRVLPLGPGRIDGLNFVVRGRHPSALGLDFALAVCKGDNFDTDCGTQVRGAMAPPYYPSVVNLTSADIPDGADRLILYARCTLPAGEACAETESVVSFSDFYVIADDPTPPAVASTTPIDGSKWFNYSPDGEINAWDPESGISRSVASANGAERTRYFCNDLYTGRYGCTTYLDPYDGDAPLEQGRNIVTVETFNGASMSTPIELSFLYDNVKPTHPVNLRALGSVGGWLVGSSLKLHWKNTTENVASTTESGIAKATVHLEPSDPPPGLNLNHVFEGTGIDSASLTLPWADTWTVQVAVVDAAGNKSDIEPITIDNEIPTMSPPTVDPANLPVFNLAGTDGPVTVTWEAGNFGRSGECGHRGWFGDGTPPFLASDSSTRVVGAGVRSWTLSRTALSKVEDGENTLALAGEDCAGAVSANRDIPIYVDRARPLASLDQSVRWLPAGTPLKVTATDPGAPASGTGVKRVWYRLAGGLEVSAPGDELTIPLAEGDHSIEYGAWDNLDNPAAQQPEPTRIGVDSVAPSVSIVPSSAAPGTFTAVLRDSTSGVVDAWCEIAKTGASAWSRIGDRFVSSQGQTSAVALGLRVPDDNSLPPGDYSIRVVARDAAGNLQTAIAQTLRLPLRAKTSLTASIYSAAKPKVAKPAITLDAGAKAGIRGKLLASDGSPIVGATLRVLAQRDAGGKRVVGEVRTGSDGAYSLALGPDVSRGLTVVFDGDGVHGAVSTSVRQNVRAAVSLRLSAKHIRRGGRLFANGRVKLLSASVPSRGVPVEIQFCGRKGCTRVGVSGETDSDGGFSIPITTSYSGPTKLELRARVESFPGWPFAAGSSDRRTVKIR